MAERYYVKKTLNNNCMMVDVDGREKLLIGKGIAFGKKSGDPGELTAQVEKIFVIEEKKNVAEFQQLLRRNDEEFIAFCEDLIWELSQQVNRSLNERIHVSLIDHISCTLYRLKVGEPIINPFLQEIRVLYAREFVLAEELCRKVELHYQVTIPQGEIGFVALHIHSAMYNGRIQDALKSNRICNRVVNLLEEEFGSPIDKNSFDCARFMVHLTYLMKRLSDHTPVENELAEMIVEQYPKAFAISQKTARLLEKELKLTELPLEELAFLTTHIERLRRNTK